MRLLDDHDLDLVPKMRKAAEEIFNHHFLPNFIESYYEVSSSNSSKAHGSVTIPARSDCDENRRSSLLSYLINQGDLEKELDDHIIPLIVNRVHWHPCLGINYLNDLVKLSHNAINPLFGISQQEELSKQVYSHIISCLPDAKTTRWDLDTLHAMLHIFAQAGHGWCPPPEFSLVVIEFLKVSSSRQTHTFATS